ncbi:MAG: hypothetical protein DMF61_02690 [Blastocatellia bacterium AA13]|nr:MAG: hypothetical protein DMF61_02690 [Blastocatellia bacterium AA13]
MRTSLNLSSRPFINHRLYWVAVVLVLAVCGWSWVWLNGQKLTAQAKADSIEAQIRAREADEERAKKEEEKRRIEKMKMLLSEQEMYQLAAARQMISNKSFSWDQMIKDVDQYVPDNARVTNLKMTDFAAAGEGSVAQVELKALGKTTGEMTEMMKRLEDSNGRFRIAEAMQEQANEAGEIPFTLQLQYKITRGVSD